MEIGCLLGRTHAEPRYVAGKKGVRGVTGGAGILFLPRVLPDPGFSLLTLPTTEFHRIIAEQKDALQLILRPSPCHRGAGNRLDWSSPNLRFPRSE